MDANIIFLVLALWALVGFFVYQLIKVILENKFREDWKKERTLSKADISFALGVFYMRLYRTLYEGKTKSQDPKGIAKREIDNALHEIDRVFRYLDEIKEKEEIERVICLAKNNLVYYLARKWNYYKDNKSDIHFRKYLEKNIEQAKDYNKDKLIVEESIDYLKEKKAASAYPDFSKNIEDTLAWAKEIFTVEIDIDTKTRM